MSLAELLRPLSTDLAAQFADVPAPVAVRATSPGFDTGDEMDAPDLGDATARMVMLAGAYSVLDQPGLHALAARVGAPVANTWSAKGIYAWDSPHHMGTCGLQRDDFRLLGFDQFDLIIAVGVDAIEAPVERYALAAVVGAMPGRLADLGPDAARPLLTGSNQLYERMAAIAQPGYVDTSTPRHPARAVMDLKQSLRPDERVTAQPGLAGLWIARTFPTDRMGSVIVPAVDRPGIGAAVGLVSAGQGTTTVCVVRDPADPVTAEVMDVARAHDLPLRLEVWGADVDWSRTEDLIAAAGPVVAWT